MLRVALIVLGLAFAPPLLAACDGSPESSFELLQPDEEELRPGTWVEVDVVGVTEQGAEVRSIHPRFNAAGKTQHGYFAYRLDPEAPPRTLEVRALVWLERTEFRGLPRIKAKPANVVRR